MTFIEFFEKDAIENICSSLAKAPERVILIGDKLKLMQKYAERYRAILQVRNVNVEFICRVVSKNNMRAVIDVLSRIVEEYDDCVIDLTGGEDLYLVAVGIVFEKYRDRGLQMHRFNIRNNTIVDCDQDGHTIMENEAPALTVEENIRLYGGDIVYEEQREKATCRWDMNGDFRSDIGAMWDICRKDVGAWNAQLGVLEAAERMADSSDALTFSFPEEELREEVRRGGGRYVINRGILESLRGAGLLRSWSCTDGTFSAAYKNGQVKRCLTAAGRILEMKIYLAALETQEKDGSRTYNDAMNGVFIDWDGSIGGGDYDTENEIDVVMMHGMLPVFVSCKNGHIGHIDKDELYKLNTVAARFGGKYARKALVATALDNSDRSKYFRQRARDMDILLVEGYSHNGTRKKITKMNDAELRRLVRSFWEKTVQ